MQKPWWGLVSGLYFDFAAKQHRTEGAVAKSSVAEIWKSRTGLEGKMRQLQNEEDGVNLLRTLLKPHPRTGRPHLLVDKRCKGFIAECGGGIAPSLKEDIPNIGPWLRDKETNRLIDRNNHATKAVVYRQIIKYGWVEKTRRPPTPVATLG